MIYSNSTPRLDLQQVLSAGIGCLQQGRLEEAWRAFAEVLNADPNNALAHQLCGLVLHQAGHAQDSIVALRRSIALNPRDASAHNNLANVLRETGEYEEALVSAERAIDLDRGLAEAKLTRANILMDLGRPAESVEIYDKLLAARPAFAQAWNNRGNALSHLNRHAEAVKSFDRALALEPDVAEIRVNSGYAKLAVGDMEGGLEHFEWRWRNHVMQGYLQSRNFGAPFWRGEEPLDGRTLLLHSEQGFGDILQFCRYAPLAAARGARVIVEVEAALVELMRTLPGVSEVVEFGQPLPAFDLHCPMMSLPYAFRTRLDSIPAQTPYLFADPAKIAAWAERLGPGTRPRVGLAWSSGVRPDQPELRSVNGRRNIPLARLERLKGAPVELHSLQKGQPAEGEFAALDQSAWDGPPIVDWAPLLTDFSQTAALMANLDLIVSVDTSIVHLAGALGRPVWVMARFDACWRWLRDRDDSLWYPTARLFRQTSGGDWDGVLDRVLAALDAL